MRGETWFSVLIIFVKYCFVFCKEFLFFLAAGSWTTKTLVVHIILLAKKIILFFSWNCNYVLISRKIIFQTFQTGVCAPFDFFSSFSSDSGFLVSVVVVSSTMAFFSGVGFTSSANLPFSGSSNASFSSSRGSPDLAIIFWEGESKKRKKTVINKSFLDHYSEKKVYAWWNCLVKRFEICHIFLILSFLIHSRCQT